MSKLYTWLRFMAIMPTRSHSTRSVSLTRRWWSGSWASCTRPPWWGIVSGKSTRVTFHFMPSLWMTMRLAGLPHYTFQPVTCAYPVLRYLNSCTNRATGLNWNSVIILPMSMILVITHDSVDAKLRLILPHLRCYLLSLSHFRNSNSSSITVTVVKNKESMELT